MATGRSRLRPAESRARALEAAREILIEQGPQAVTLKAVATRIGRTHANLLHHFGSASGLQQALAISVATRIGESVALALVRTRKREADPREIVDLTFDAFAKEGLAALAAWAVVSGQRTVLDPVVDAIRRLVNDLGEFEGRTLRTNALALMLSAIGDALLGDFMADALQLPRETSRDLALRQLLHFGGRNGEAGLQG